jgi:hypothetical protein
MSAERVILLPGDHVLEATVQRCRIESFDGEHRHAKISLDLESPRKEGRGGDHPSTKLAIHLGEEGARELLLALQRLSRDLKWALTDLPTGPGFQKQVFATPSSRKKD